MKALSLTFCFVVLFAFATNAQDSIQKTFASIERYLQQRSLDSMLFSVNRFEQLIQSKPDTQRSEEYFRLGKLLINTPRPDFAEKHLKQSLQIAQASTLKIDVLDALAQASYLQGKLQQAIEYAHGSLFLSLKDKREEAISNTYANLGMIHEEWASYDSAYYFYTHSLELYKVQDTLSTRVVEGYKKLGIFHKNTANYKEAEKCYETALSILKALDLPAGQEHADLYYNLGNVFREQNQFHKAKRYFTYSLNIEKRLLPPGHPSRAYTLTNLGLIEDGLGNTQEAIRYFEETFTIYKQAFGDIHPAIGGTLSNLAGAYGDLGELEKAYAYNKEAIQIFTQVFGENHPAVAGISRNLAALYMENAVLDLGTYWLNYSKKIHEVIYPPAHPEHVELTYKLAEKAYFQGELDSSLFYIQKALWNLAGEASPTTAQLHFSSFPSPQKLKPAEFGLKVLRLKADILQIKKHIKEAKICFNRMSEVTDEEMLLNITDTNDKINFVDDFALEHFKAAAYFHFMQGK